MISKTRHSETDVKGNHLYVIEARFSEDVEDSVGLRNTDYDGVKLGCKFKRGRASTIDPDVAQRFSEEFGYVIYVHKDIDPWEEVKEPKRKYLNYRDIEDFDIDDDEDGFLEADEDDEDEEEE